VGLKIFRGSMGCPTGLSFDLLLGTKLGYFRIVFLAVLGQPSCGSKHPTKSELFPLKICPQIFGLLLFNASCYKDKLWMVLLSKLAFNNMH
jgi:hypothetical protein